MDETPPRKPYPTDVTDEELPRVAVGLHFAACLSLLIARALAVFTQVGSSL